MLFFQTLARVAPRGLTRAVVLAASRGSALAGVRLAPAVIFSAASVSTSARRLGSQNKSTEVADRSLASMLADKLQSEIELEHESLQEENVLEESIQERLTESGWKVDTKDGSDEVKLTRSFGSDNVIVTFSLTDLSSWSPPAAEVDGEEEGDEEPRQRTGKQLGGPVDGNEDELDDNMEDADEGSPIPLNIVIEKSGRTKTVLSVDAGILEGVINIEDVRLFDDLKLATADSAAAAMLRASLYAGPQFNTLDEDLQALIERYLDDRGVNSDLAHLVTELVQHKEQKEYVRWLQGVKAFVKA